MKKRMVIIISFSLMCLILASGGLFYWIFEQWKEQKLEWSEQNLQKYVGRLEDEGYVFEERSLTEFDEDRVVEVYWFSDFRGIARVVDATCIYIDREIGALYFISGKDANVFYCNKDFVD